MKLRSPISDFFSQLGEIARCLAPSIIITFIQLSSKISISEKRIIVFEVESWN